MNREIKFRGRVFETGQWLYGSLIQFNYKRAMIYDQEKDHEESIEENTIGQFTGLKDKNGVEIYEGNIIAYMNKEQWYQTEAFNMRLFDKSEKEISKRMNELPYHTLNVVIPDIYNVSEIDEYEVIGNIHDKEEL